MKPTCDAIDAYEKFWGATELSKKFRALADKNGVGIYDRSLNEHFTGSVVLINVAQNQTLLTLHPRSKKWQQLGGHDEGEHNPYEVARRELVEESGVSEFYLDECPAHIEPHLASGCSTVRGGDVYHYDICYVATTSETIFKPSSESLDMRWFTQEEVEEGNLQENIQKHGYRMLRAAFEMVNRVPGF